ncbi:MAG: PEP-CTERM sorting domain-containing protein [Neisseriaceae bacterium]|nr:MAG: PEP-CTERM sorting domain-containing protein [Neisseriaceae bacterium]
MKHTAIATLTAALLAALSGTTLAASADVVTFEDLPLNQQASHYVSGDFSFSGSYFGGEGPMYAHLEGEKVYNGTQYLIWGWGPAGILSINRTDNAAFNLTSLDLGNSYYTHSNGWVTLTADYATGGSYTTQLALNDSFQRYNLGLKGLSQVRISGLDDGEGVGYTAIDNFNVAAVPEPETYAMLLAGLGVVVTAARRRSTLAA